MNSALAIASVTAVLKNLLDNGLMHQSTTANMGDVIVSALPPDRIATGAEEHAQLNLYLYRLTPNSSWQRVGISSSQEVREAVPSLALDLHYLLTAYGERDFQAEILLGYAIQLLLETPILTREAIRSALASVSAGNAGGAALATLAMLSASTLADQFQQVKISPEFLSTEDMSKLWSSLQTRSRLSVTYQASMVLIEDHRVAAATQADLSKVRIS
ncbi:MAG: hypothetical protein NVS4B7_01030 [Ktedonobacteraceae bacterium]